MAQRLFGISGRYCAGKNYVSRLFEKRNIPVLDIDKLGHEVIRLEARAIVRRFGETVLDPSGAVDRKRLGELVFGDAVELAALEAIVHPAANRLTEAWVEQQAAAGPRAARDEPEAAPDSWCALNAALLHRSSVYDRLLAIVVVEAPLAVRFFRAFKRDKLPLKELFRRFQSQNNFPLYKNGPGRAQLFFCPADIYSIRNSGFFGSTKRLEKRIDAVLEGLNYGKEKAAVSRRLGGSIPGNRGERRDSDF